MNPRGSATVAAAFYPAVVIAGWAFVSLSGITSPRIENAAAAHAVVSLAPSLAANVDLAAAPQANAAVAPQAIAPQAIAPQAILH